MFSHYKYIQTSKIGWSLRPQKCVLKPLKLSCCEVVAAAFAVLSPDSEASKLSLFVTSPWSEASENIGKHDKFHDKIWIATRYDIHTWIWIQHFDDYDWTIIPKKTNTNKTYLWTKQVPDRSKQFKMIFLVVKRDFEGCVTSKPVVNRWLWTGLGAFYLHCWNVISKPWLAKPLIHAQMDVFGGVIIDAFF